MNRQRWLRTRRRLAASQTERSLPHPGEVIEYDPRNPPPTFEQIEELKNVLPKPSADYVLDTPWGRP